VKIFIKKSIKKYFPYIHHRNILIYYLVSIFNSCWFVEGNWIFFLTRYITFGQFGIIESLVFTLGLLFEIPAGAISDLFGKKISLILGMFASFLGALVLSSVKNESSIIYGYIVLQFGWAFTSGTLEAFAYDSLVEKKDEKNYDKVVSANNSLMIIVFVITSLTGGLLYNIYFRLPYIVWSVCYLVAMISLFFAVEPEIKEKVEFTFNNFIKQFIQGVKELIKPNLKKFLVIIIVFSGINYAYDMGFIKPLLAVNFGFKESSQSIIYACIGLVIAFTVRLMPVIRKKLSDEIGLLILMIVQGLAYLTASLTIGYSGIFVLLSLDIIGSMIYPWISIIVNDKVPSKYRATTLSTLNLITKIPYVLIAVIAGNLMQEKNFELFTISLSMIIFVSVIISSFLMIRRNYNKEY